MDKFTKTYLKIIKEATAAGVQAPAEDGALHDAFVAKLQKWFPDEDVDEILDCLSMFEAQGDLPAKAYKKMEELQNNGVSEFNAFYQVYNEWPEEELKKWIADELGTPFVS